MAMLLGMLIYSGIFIAYSLIASLIAVAFYSPEFESSRSWL